MKQQPTKLDMHITWLYRSETILQQFPQTLQMQTNAVGIFVTII